MTVTLSRCRTSSALVGSNRGIMVSVAPQATAVFSPQVWPNEWNSGSPPKMTSSGPPSNKEIDTATLDARLLWVSSAPLGFPVVPEVYSRTAVSSGSRSITSGAGV